MPAAPIVFGREFFEVDPRLTALIVIDMQMPSWQKAQPTKRLRPARCCLIWNASASCLPAFFDADLRDRGRIFLLCALELCSARPVTLQDQDTSGNVPSMRHLTSVSDQRA